VGGGGGGGGGGGNDENDVTVPVGCVVLEKLSEDVIAHLLGQFLSPTQVCRV